MSFLKHMYLKCHATLFFWRMCFSFHSDVVLLCYIFKENYLKFSLKLHFVAKKFETNPQWITVDHIMLENVLSLVYLMGSEQILSGWYSQF